MKIELCMRHGIGCEPRMLTRATFGVNPIGQIPRMHSIALPSGDWKA